MYGLRFGVRTSDFRVSVKWNRQHKGSRKVAMGGFVIEEDGLVCGFDGGVRRVGGIR